MGKKMKFVTDAGKVKEYFPHSGYSDCYGGGLIISYLCAHNGWVLIDVGTGVPKLLDACKNQQLVYELSNLIKLRLVEHESKEGLCADLKWLDERITLCEDALIRNPKKSAVVISLKDMRFKQKLLLTELQNLVKNE